LPYPPLRYFQSGSHQPRRAMIFHRAATNPLNFLSHWRGSPHSCSCHSPAPNPQFHKSALHAEGCLYLRQQKDAHLRGAQGALPSDERHAPVRLRIHGEAAYTFSKAIDQTDEGLGFRHVESSVCGWAGKDASRPGSQSILRPTTTRKQSRFNGPSERAIRQSLSQGLIHFHPTTQSIAL